MVYEFCGVNKMEYNLIAINFSPTIGAVFLLVFLFTNSKIDVKIKNMFYSLVGLQLLEMVLFSMELVYAGRSEPTVVTTILTAMGYVIRPMMVIVILEIALRNHPKLKMYRKIFITLQVINAAVAFSALFIDIAYTYDVNNTFVRGPLGFVPHIITVIYQLFLLVLTLRNREADNRLESTIILIMVGVIVFTMFLETLNFNLNIGRTTIILSIIFYYMYFQSQAYAIDLNEEFVLRKNLEKENRTEGLTGLWNKKFFENEAKKIIEKKDWENIAFVFIDLDNFKNINDYLGHPMGDQVLMDVANIIRSVFRKNDLIARFGGDEFCVLLTNIPINVVEHQLDTILEFLRIEYKNEKHKVSISSSIGVVYCKRNNVQYIELLEKADEALYKAKNSGKDRYVIENM